MASNIDATKPTEGTATTQSVRDNFSAAKDEIEALQSTPSISSYTEYQEASEPSPGTNAARLYAFDQNGETRMHYITPDGLVIDIAQDNTFVVRNQSGSNMSKGDVVYVSSQTGPVPDVELAQSNSLSTVPAVGVLAEDIDNNDFGVAIKVGILESINTSAFNVGDVLYVSASVAGGLTATRPPHPHLNQPVATVLVSGVGNGSIKIDIEYPEGDELGTRENTYKIGDGTAGTITLTFDNDADGSLTWDGTQFSIGGKEFALDSDGNTSITADTDDQIDVKIGGSDQFSFTAASLNTSLLAETTESGMRGVLKIGDALRGFIDGLILRNSTTDSDHDIDMRAGAATLTDGSNFKLFESTNSNFTKQIDVDWAEGSNSGGFPSNLTLSSSTWYHFFIIGKDDGTKDAGFDTSLTATNLLSDASSYSWYRRIGSVLTDGSSNITSFVQVGETFYWDSPKRDYNDTNPGTSEVARALTVPPDIRVKPIHYFHLEDQSPAGSTIAYVHSPDLTDNAAAFSGITTTYLANNTSSDRWVVGTWVDVHTNTSRQIDTRLDNSDSGIIVTGFTHGWHDPRGRRIT